jgi:hypothetical protein
LAGGQNKRKKERKKERKKSLTQREGRGGTEGAEKVQREKGIKNTE